MEETTPVHWDIDSARVVALLRHVKNMPGINSPVHNIGGSFAFFLFTLKTKLPSISYLTTEHSKFDTLIRVHQGSTFGHLFEKRYSLQCFSRTMEKLWARSSQTKICFPISKRFSTLLRLWKSSILCKTQTNLWFLDQMCIRAASIPDTILRRPLFYLIFLGLMWEDSEDKDLECRFM